MQFGAYLVPAPSVLGLYVYNILILHILIPWLRPNSLLNFQGARCAGFEPLTLLLWPFGLPPFYTYIIMAVAEKINPFLQFFELK